MYTVKVKKKVLKSIQKIPKARQEDFYDLIEDLRSGGPVQKGWPNFSVLDLKLGTYHCHLSSRWGACWKVLQNKTLELEVYYVGSREKAPY